MRRSLVIALIAIQLGILAYMAGGREYILAYGETVWLQTAPIDPRDPFRGDFVRLAYALNSFPAALLGLDTEDVQSQKHKGKVVYASLTPAGRDVYQFATVSFDEPGTMPFLKGRITNQRTIGNTNLHARFGIEQLFVQQGRGKEIEAQRGMRDSTQVPMEMLVSIGGDGTAVIKDYRWSEIGMRSEILRSNERRGDDEVQNEDLPLSPAVRVYLRNVSSQPLAVFEDPHLCQFVLVRGDDPNYQDVVKRDACSPPTAARKTLRVLSPQEEVGYTVDLSDPEWFVLRNGLRFDIATVESAWDMYRLVYRGASQDADTKMDEKLWQGVLPSRAFNLGGRMD